MAQTDVTKYFLSNYSFDSDFHYTSSSSTAVAQEIKEIDGWTPGFDINYTITGVYEFGFGGTFNGASVPAKGYDGEAGGCLALSTGWGNTFNYYQTVTLPAGTYTIKVPTYNGTTTTAASSALAWIPNSGTQTTSTVTSYKGKSWTLDEINFTLSKTTTGKVQIGMVAAAGSSTNSAKICIDYVQILVTDMAVDKSGLKTTLTSANSSYGTGTGNGASALKSAIDAAQAVYDDASAEMVTVLEMTETLEEAIDTYKKQNISEENPYDCTSYIPNPSFEDGIANWTISNLVSQTNTSFTKKSGSVYFEKWVASGNVVGDGSAVQTITNVPNGVYKLTVGAQNYSQNSTSKKNTGAYIFADDQQTPVYTPGDYSVTFTNITGQVKIGFIAEGATGNWLAVDNFRLYQIGEVDNSTIISELTRIVKDATALQPSMMSGTVATTLQSTIDVANAVIAGTKDYSADVTLNLFAAMESAEQSIAEYELLQSTITSVESSYDETKEGASDFLAALNTAKALVVNSAATSADLANGVEVLEKALLAFNIANATAGTGSAPKVTSTNHFVPTGATQALVRASFSGSNIIERGVCWSTEHNPTVLDNRTTKYFTQNGYVLHIKGLTPATVYYVRPYVMNKTYTVAYGDEVKIVTHPAGNCVGTWDNGAPTEEANIRCYNAIQETIEYFNEWTGIRGFTLSGHYGASTPTADCSYGGWMRIGPTASYQAIGTVLHETGHGVGVGTHWRWYNCSDTREGTTKGKWLGRAANDMLDFLENNYTESMYLTGDAVHGWGSNATYDWFVNGADKDKHYELQYIGGCALLYSLFIDGLCPTTSYNNGISGYTYNFDDDKKYYIMSKGADNGVYSNLLYVGSNSSSVYWSPKLEQSEISDSAAWNIEYNPERGYYMFKNVLTGKYLTHKSSANYVTTKEIGQNSTLSTTEYFQLMPDRTDVTIGSGSDAFTTHGYWFTWYDSGSKAMSANAYLSSFGYGNIGQTSFNYSDSATKQQWIIISEDELSTYKKAAIAMGINRISVNDSNADGTATVMGIYTVGGAKLQNTQSGVNIIRYSDGTSKKIIFK